MSYPKFIEVHTKDETSVAVSINVAAIKCIHPDLDEDLPGKSGVIETVEDSNCYVTESYEELKTMIKDCGCLIHKQDPRLDTTTPLTMDDLLEMIGEPVWNSNNGRWYLVWMIEEYDTDRPVHLRYMDGVPLSMRADDLMKYPLYRMKQESLVDKLNEVRRKK